MNQDEVNKRTLATLRVAIAKEEKEIVDLNADVRVAVCLNRECDVKGFFVIKEYKSKVVTCPFCEEKHKVRSYKNGSINVSICER